MKIRGFHLECEYIKSEIAKEDSVLMFTFLEELIEQEDNETGDEELDDDEQADAGADVRGLAVHAGHHVHDGLAEGDHHAEHC